MLNTLLIGLGRVQLNLEGISLTLYTYKTSWLRVFASKSDFSGLLDYDYRPSTGRILLLTFPLSTVILSICHMFTFDDQDSSVWEKKK
jgi:hypothetical protein